MVYDPVEEFQALALLALFYYLPFGGKNPFQECFVFYMQREVMAEEEVKLVDSVLFS